MSTSHLKKELGKNQERVCSGVTKKLTFSTFTELAVQTFLEQRLPYLLCSVSQTEPQGNGTPLHCCCLENPRDGEPGGLPSMGSHRVGHDWSDLAAVAQMVKRLSTMWETWVRSLGRDVACRRKRQPTPVLLPRKSHGRRSLVSMGSQRVGHDWATSFSHSTQHLKELTVKVALQSVESSRPQH